MVKFLVHGRMFSEMVTTSLVFAAAISYWRVDSIPIDFSSIPPRSGLTAQWWPLVSGFEHDLILSKSFAEIMRVKSGVTGVDLVIMNASAAVDYFIFLYYRMTAFVRWSTIQASNCYPLPELGLEQSIAVTSTSLLLVNPSHDVTRAIQTTGCLNFTYQNVGTWPNLDALSHFPDYPFMHYFLPETHQDFGVLDSTHYCDVSTGSCFALASSTTTVARLSWMTVSPSYCLDFDFSPCLRRSNSK